MSTNVGSIHYDLSLDHSKFDKAASSVRDGMGDMATRALNIGKKIAVAFGAMTAAAGAFGIKSAADFQQTRIGLENMLGSADKAKSLLADISKFAAETPFEFPELAQATKQLIAFGFGAEEAFSTMKGLGDVSAAVGAPINDLAYLMGTLRTQGRAFTIDIRQFAQRGIPIYEYLAKVLKTNEKAITGMIEEGKIGFPEVQKAFQAMTAEGGKFHNTMAKQSKSLSGLFSTLKDNIGAALREAIGINTKGDIRSGSIFEKLSEGVTRLNGVLGKVDWVKVVKIVSDSFGTFFTKVTDLARQIFEYLQPSLKALWNTLTTDVLPILNRLWKEVIVPLIPVIGVLLVGAFRLAVDAVNLMFSVLTPVVSWMLDNKEYVLAFAAAIGVIWATMKIQDGINTFMNGLDVAKLAMARFQTEGLGSLNASLTGFAGWGIFAAAAVAAFVLIAQKARETIGLLDEIAGKKANVDKGTDTALRRANEQYKAGIISKERYNQILQGAFRADGGPVSGGSPYIVGERGPEMFVPNRSGMIIPNELMGKMGTTNNFNAPIYIKDRADADYLLGQLMRDDEVMSHGMTPRRAIYGS